MPPLRLQLFICWCGVTAFISNAQPGVCQEAATFNGTAVLEGKNSSQTVTSLADANKLAEATNALKSLVENDKLAGAVVMVSRRGTILLEESVGLARKESKQPMTLDYMRFCEMLYGMGERAGVRLLKEDTVREMTRNQMPPGTLPIVVNGNRRQGVGFGLGFRVIVEPIRGFEYVPQGEYGWDGAASTHFWISPKHEIAVVVLTQLMPFNFQAVSAVKPIIYDALK